LLLTLTKDLLTFGPEITVLTIVVGRDELKAFFTNSNEISAVSFDKLSKFKGKSKFVGTVGPLDVLGFAAAAFHWSFFPIFTQDREVLLAITFWPTFTHEPPTLGLAAIAG
jgi:hypothetical protein